jgi:hypothetical protein
MSHIRLRSAEPDVTLAPDARGAADERRLALLRQIALAGGKVAPAADPDGEHGYSYAALGDDAARDLDILARRNYLEQRFFDRVSLCPQCDSHHLNVREICPGCRRSHLANDGLLHHFRCGYVGIPSEFSPADDGSYLCPKCNSKMRHMGSEFDRLGKAFACRGCGLISENPPVEAVCFACTARTPAEDLISALVFSYVLTSRGATALRRGSLLDGDEEVVAIADAPAYRRTVTLEFLDHELNRLKAFNSGFSLLLARCASEAIDSSGGDAPAEWLSRMRHCLREVDRIGQLADALYVAILPQTKWRAAEALRLRIEAELGPQSPLTLSTVEITEPRHLAQVLAGLDGRGEHS